MLSAVHCESSRLTELNKILRKDADLHVLRYFFPRIQESTPEMALSSALDLEVICTRPKLQHAKFKVLGSMVLELNDLRMVCLLKTFEVLQVKVNGVSLVGFARPVPRALNKHYSARRGPIIVSVMFLHRVCKRLRLLFLCSIESLRFQLSHFPANNCDSTEPLIPHHTLHKHIKHLLLQN